MPTSFNLPLSLLQSIAEEFEYADLLDKAAHMEDPVDRIAFVAAFAVSGYAHTRNRCGRKPFNPLLGETYELIRADKGFRFIAEKVVHHP
ncbi:Oxysterol-binding protein, partial [Gonapodya sp. JEL0774]